jgi:hypothetical protein
LFRPDDPTAPPGQVFDAPWQAQAMALADTLVQAGHVTPGAWAQALGDALRSDAITALPDSLDTYYRAVVMALETVFDERVGVSKATLTQRRHAWEKAFRDTPHGQPVVLK